MSGWLWVASGVLLTVSAVVVYDLLQRRHAILRNFPVIGHFRYLLELVGPELRQYVVTSNNEERPFSRDQRRWVYATSKQQNPYFGYGTDTDLEFDSQTLIIQHATLPPLFEASAEKHSPLPCAKVIGAARRRRHAFRPPSLVNVSGMSFGSLSARAVEALNRGAQLAGCLQNTGEGGVSRYHQHGADLVFQLATACFGCRDAAGNFELSRLVDLVETHPIRAIEIKLSQGAKPGIGGFLPGAKVTDEIAEARGIPVGRDCRSPARNPNFRDADSLLDFAEEIAAATGLPVGLKSAVGEMKFWQELADCMVGGTRGVDFINIDGGEGGTGAGPLVFTDHVALPFKLGFSRVYRIFAERALVDDIVFGGSGKLGFPAQALLATGLGCDWIHVGREAMLAIGCIQAQRCHTGHCPTGVATQNRWLMGGLDPTHKGARLANYLVNLRMELQRLAHACGVAHPALVPLERLEILTPRFHGRTASEVFGYKNGWGLPGPADRQALEADVHPG